MPSAAVLFADGFEDIEAITPCDVLTRAGIQVTSVGVTGMEVKSSHKQFMMKMDKSLKDAMNDTYDVIILPGGMPGSKNLAESEDVIKMLKAQKAAGRWIAAICASPSMTLHDKGIMEPSQKGVCYPAMSMGGNDLGDDKALSHVDGKIITSRSPGTALDFSLTIVEQLVSMEKAKEVAKALFYHYGRF